MKRKIFCLVNFLTLFTLVIFFVISLYAQEETETLEIEKVEIFIPTDEIISPEFSPIEDELLIQDLQLKENFVDSDEQLNINVFLFSSKFYKNLFEVSYISLSSFFVLYNISGFMNDFLIDLKLNLINYPFYIEFNKDLINNFLLELKFLNDLKTNKKNDIILKNDLIINYNNFNNELVFYKILNLKDNLLIFDSNNLINLKFEYFKNNYSLIYFFNINYEKYFDYINIGFNINYNNIISNFLFEIFINGYYFINNEFLFIFKLVPYYYKNEGLDFKGELKINILSESKKFIEINISRGYYFFDILNFDFLKFSYLSIFNTIQEIYEENYYYSFINFNNINNLSKYYNVSFSINLYFPYFELEINLFYKYFVNLFSIIYTNYFFETSFYQKVNQFYINLNIYYFLNREKNFYLKNDLFINIFSNLQYNNILRNTLSFVGEKDSFFINKFLFSIEYFLIKYIQVGNINYIPSLRVIFSLNKEFNNTNIFLNIIYHFKDFYITPFYRIKGLYFQFGINFYF